LEVIFLRGKSKGVCGQHPSGYTLRSCAFRPEQECDGKISYHFLYENGQVSFPDSDYNFLLQTQLLANKLLSGVDGYIFYVQIFIEAARRVSWREIIPLVCWKDEKDIEFLFCESLDRQSTLQRFSFCTRSLNAVSQKTALIAGRDSVGINGIYADYYAIRENALFHETPCKSTFSSIKDKAEIALISDDTHGVWTILRTENYPQNLLTENLKTFCAAYSEKLYIYI